MSEQETSLERRTQKVLLDTVYLKSWNEHIDQLIRLGFHTTSEERMGLMKIMDQLRDLAVKCAERQLEREKENEKRNKAYEERADDIEEAHRLTDQGKMDTNGNLTKGEHK